MMKPCVLNEEAKCESHVDRRKKVFQVEKGNEREREEEREEKERKREK